MTQGGHIKVEPQEDILIEEKTPLPPVNGPRDLTVLQSEELKPAISNLLGKRDLIHSSKLGGGQWSDSDSDNKLILSKLKEQDEVKTHKRRRDKYDVEYD